jgi:hypothetical protein
MLCVRSVSVPSDEALRLLCLAGFDTDIVLPVPPSVTERMTVFWTQMGNIPTSLVFSKYPQKHEVPGFRWAPAKVLGSLPRNEWAGKPEVEQDITAMRAAEGLRVLLPGYRLSIDLNDLPDSECFFLRCQGDWYRVYLSEPRQQHL